MPQQRKTQQSPRLIDQIGRPALAAWTATAGYLREQVAPDAVTRHMGSSVAGMALRS